MNVKTPPLRFTTIPPARAKAPLYYEVREDEDGGCRVTCNGFNVARFPSRKIALDYYEGRVQEPRGKRGGLRPWTGNCPKCVLDGRKNTLTLERSGGFMTKECGHCSYESKAGRDPG